MDNERRRHDRVRTGGTAAVYHADGRPFAYTTLTDISASGCYIDTLFPLEIGTLIQMTISVDGTQNSLTTAATVRTFDRGVGMGVEFAEQNLEEVRKLLESRNAVGQ